MSAKPLLHSSIDGSMRPVKLTLGFFQGFRVHRIVHRRLAFLFLYSERRWQSLVRQASDKIRAKKDRHVPVHSLTFM